MNGILKDIMNERADALDSPPVDVTAIQRVGDRRVRRRRTALVGGLAAASLALGGMAWSILPDSSGRAREGLVADGTSVAPLPLSWVVGDTVHQPGKASIQLDAEARAWVWSGPGALAYADAEHRIHVWRSGSDEVVGHGVRADFSDEDKELVAGSGRLGWHDSQAGFTVLDLSSGVRSSIPVQLRTDHTPQLSAIDGTTAYGRDARGVFEWDLSTGVVKVIDPDPANLVLDAENGVVIRKVGHEGTATVTGGTARLQVDVDALANISPDGSQVMAESNDEGHVVDIATGNEHALDTGKDWYLPFQWLTDDTVSVLAFDVSRGTEGQREVGPFMMQCTVSTGACGEAHLVEADPGGVQFQLPIGTHIG